MNIIEEVEIEFSREEARRFSKWENDRLKNLSQIDFGKIYSDIYSKSYGSMSEHITYIINNYYKGPDK